MAGYYGAPLGLTLKACCPGGMWGESQVVGVPGARGRRRRVGSRARWSSGSRAEAARRRCRAAARALKRPLWDVLDRLARVGAVTLRVEPPDTDADALTERVAALAGDPPTLLERDDAVPARPASSGGCTRRSRGSAGARSVSHVTGQLGFSAAVLRALERRGLVRIGQAERLRDPFAGFSGGRRRRRT